MLCITGFLAMAGGALLAPVLPEMVGPLQTNTNTIGLLMSVYTLSTAIFTLIIGHFIDRVNRKKVLIPCLVIYGVTGLFSFFITDLTSMLILRFIQGIGVAGMMTLALLIIGDVYKGFDSVKAISRVSMSLAIGAISAPVIGGGLAILGWNYPFLFYALSLPFALIVIVLLPETKDQKMITKPKGLLDALPALREIPISYTIFMAFVVYFLLYSLITYVPFMLKEMFGFASAQSGLMLAVEGIAVVLITSRVNTLTRRFSLISVIIGGFALIGVAFICMPYVNSIAIIILLLVLFGAGYGLAQTAIDIQIVQIIPSLSKGGILSIHTCMKYMGMSLSPIVLGVVLTFSGLYSIFIITGIFGLLIALVTCGFRKQYNSKAIHQSKSSENADTPA